MIELDPIETFFASYPPEIQAISRTLRVMVQSAMPQAHEILFAKQNHIAYSFSTSRRDTITYICPLKDYARLGFMYGTHLADPHQMLTGEGKRLRHVKVRTSEEANNPALKQLVESAWADALTHMKKKPKA
ncbi:MAG TPA: DUF1801 domain-containing protein [Ktedonobacteraceae bacterium]|nr:DUF1801 domain-containing protein [Ktedonobacteraceae bacterium]